MEDGGKIHALRTLGLATIAVAGLFVARADAHWFGPGGFMRWLGALSGPGIHSRGSCGCVPGTNSTLRAMSPVVVEDLAAPIETPSGEVP
jgi:hypothetical protein